MTASSSLNTANSAIVPAPKLEQDFYDWYARHDAKVRQAATARHNLVFIGDSITHLFEGDPNVPGRGEKVWQEYYGHRRPLNLGFGWDRTQNVLWRLDHGELAAQTPRLAILLIGTNNLTATNNARKNTPAEIAEGVAAIRQRLHVLSPTTQALLMAIFPRGRQDDPLRQEIDQTNLLLREQSQNWPPTQYLDIGHLFLDAAGNIPTSLMADLVHPTESAYRLWAHAIEPTVSAIVDN